MKSEKSPQGCSRVLASRATAFRDVSLSSCSPVNRLGGLPRAPDLFRGGVLGRSVYDVLRQSRRLRSHGSPPIISPFCVHQLHSHDEPALFGALLRGRSCSDDHYAARVFPRWCAAPAASGIPAGELRGRRLHTTAPSRCYASQMGPRGRRRWGINFMPTSHSCGQPRNLTVVEVYSQDCFQHPRTAFPTAVAQRPAVCNANNDGGFAPAVYFNSSSNISSCAASDATAAAPAVPGGCAVPSLFFIDYSTCGSEAPVSPSSTLSATVSPTVSPSSTLSVTVSPTSTPSPTFSPTPSSTSSFTPTAATPSGTPSQPPPVTTYFETGFFGNTGCSGAPAQRNFQLFSGCFPTGTASWGAYACVGTTAAVVNIFTNPQCSGSPAATQPVPITFGTCAPAGEGQSIIQTCVNGAFPNPGPAGCYLETSFTNGVGGAVPDSCPIAANQTRASVTCTALDACLLSGAFGLAYSCTESGSVLKIFDNNACSGAPLQTNNLPNGCSPGTEGSGARLSSCLPPLPPSAPAALPQTVVIGASVGGGVLFLAIASGLLFCFLKNALCFKKTPPPTTFTSGTSPYSKFGAPRSSTLQLPMIPISPRNRLCYPAEPCGGHC